MFNKPAAPKPWTGSWDTGQSYEKGRWEAEKEKVLTSHEAMKQVWPVNRGSDTDHCVIRAMSEGCFSANSNEKSDRPACKDLSPDKDKEDS